MVDAHVGGGSERRLGVIGDAEAGALDHQQIVGAVARGEGFLRDETEAGKRILQRGELRLAAEDRLGDPAGQPARGDFEPVAVAFVEADHPGNSVGERGESAGDEDGAGAVRPHGADQLAAAGRQRDALDDHAADRLLGQAGEEAYALAERRGEVELAAHGALGDVGDLRLEAGEIGKLVDAFLLDHGRIHVGDELALATAGGRLHGDVGGSAGGERSRAQAKIA